MAAEMKLREYVHSLASYVDAVELTNLDGNPVDYGIELICKLLKHQQAGKHRVVVIGNGGSAAIASHVAIDLSKNAGVPALAFNDASALTCLSNDFSYQQVFAKQIEYHCHAQDVLLAISSSGESPSILNAVDTARRRHLVVVTLSGFKPENRLRKVGHYNYYVPSDQYGFVELAHLTILHAITDYLVTERAMLEAAE
jgi:D-sedoheptulose 7-phosphate isomerase